MAHFSGGPPSEADTAALFSLLGGAGAAEGGGRGAAGAGGDARVREAVAGAPGALAALEEALAGELRAAATAIGEATFVNASAPAAAATLSRPVSLRHGAAALLASLWPTLRLLLALLPRSEEVAPSAMALLNRALDAAGADAGPLTRDALQLIVESHAAAPSPQTLAALGTILERQDAGAALVSEALAAVLPATLATISSSSGAFSDPPLLAELFGLAQVRRGAG